MATYLQSIQQCLHWLLENDDRVYILGEDILDPYGGAFKATKGLSSKFGDRILSTPISEAAIVGIANGMALRGLLPIVEIMFGDFTTLIADQVINYATKFQAMYNNQVNVPVVIRTPMGGGRGYGPTHSQSLEKIFLGIPFLKIFAPSHFQDPGTILKHVVQNINSPVLFIENKRLYSSALIVESDDQLQIEIISSETLIPTTLVQNFRSGTPDVTIIGYGGMSLIVEPILRQFVEEEIRVLACFPSCIQPFPADVITKAAAESGRVIIIEEGTQAFGWGAEVSALLNKHLWGKLAAPIKRIAAKDTIIPASKSLEEVTLPTAKVVEKAIMDILSSSEALG